MSVSLQVTIQLTKASQVSTIMSTTPRYFRASNSTKPSASKPSNRYGERSAHRTVRSEERAELATA
eukprot:2332850-Pyramimonas_sp.AAC.1